ncbi:MAG: DUF262 domain-containing protein [Deltaproteobacteria bacterium]|nr:DUF262 domain-containing protein [Deltaproteobacteria bacterium]
MAEKHRKIDSNALSLGELLRRPVVFAVPVYQRDFAWTKEEVGILWTDLAAALSEGRDEYFLGAITVSRADASKRSNIIDGQQRLAVIAMIFAAIAAAWKKQGDEKRAHGVFRDYIGSEDRRTGEVLPKLSLNESNNPVFQSRVLEGETFKSEEKKLLSHSNRLLDDAQSQINKALSDWLTKSGDKSSSLLDLEEFLSASVNLILIEADDEADAFVLFETLNDRGLDLAVSDLVKNYLFSLAGTHYLERFKQAWVAIATLVGSQNLTTFLRHCWLSEYGLVRERDLYRALRENVKGIPAARQFIDKLRKRADLYAALSNPEHTYWTDAPSDVRDYLEPLSLFKVAQYRPVLFSAMEVANVELVTKILRLLLVVSYRYTVISQLGTGNLESIYTECALAIRSGKAKGIKDVFTSLRSAYVDDHRFTADFTVRQFTNSGIARYTLAQINDHLESDPERHVAERSGRVTLEHILPKNPGKAWGSVSAKGNDITEFLDRIGNLTLLEKGKNRGLGNAGFKEKKEKGYAMSGLAINKYLHDKDTWTSESIVARSQILAKLAKDVWRADY